MSLTSVFQPPYPKPHLLHLCPHCGVASLSARDPKIADEKHQAATFPLLRVHTNSHVDENADQLRTSV